jgi:hypothetical protein
MTKLAHIFPWFSLLCITYIVVTKNGLGHILGDFFSQNHVATLPSQEIRPFLEPIFVEVTDRQKVNIQTGDTHYTCEHNIYINLP